MESTYEDLPFCFIELWLAYSESTLKTGKTNGSGVYFLKIALVRKTVSKDFFTLSLGPYTRIFTVMRYSLDFFYLASRRNLRPPNGLAQNLFDIILSQNVDG